MPGDDQLAARARELRGLWEQLEPVLGLLELKTADPAKTDLLQHLRRLLK